jgi:hypothetical protein
MEAVYKVVNKKVILLSASWESDNLSRFTQVVEIGSQLQDIEVYKILEQFNKWAKKDYKEKMKLPENQPEAVTMRALNKLFDLWKTK